MDETETVQITPEPVVVTPITSEGEKDKGLILPPRPPSSKNNSWSAIISIVIILAMVIIGAFYAWGQRISEQRTTRQEMQAQTTNSAQTY